MVKLNRHKLPEEPSGEWLQRSSIAAGVLVAGVGVLVLIGWVLGLDLLKSVLPGLATMKANTALCFLFSGLALALREKPALRAVFGGIVCAVAGLTLAEYISGEDLGLDQLLFRDTVDPHTVYPGRMVQATAMGFLLSGASLLLLEAGWSRGARRTQQVLAICAGVIGVVAVLGYSYNAQQLYQFAGYSSMALHTSISFVVLALGLVLAQPNGLARMLTAPGPSSLMIRRLLPMTLVVPVITGWLVNLGRDQGYYGEGMDVAVLALAMMFSLTALVWLTAAVLTRADFVRKQAEQALLESEERFRLFMDNSPTIGWIKDEQGRHVYLSKTFEDRFGMRLEEWQGKTDADIWPAEVAEAFRKNDLDVLAADHPIEVTEETINADGSRCYWLTSKFPFRDAAGNRFVAGIGLDITERKQAEEQLHKSLAEKEAMLKEIHHRVKNNLQVISSLVSLQADTLTDERIREELNDVRDRVRSMALIHEKLYQAGNLAQLDFADYATSLMHTLWRSHSALAKNVRLNLAVEPVSMPIETAVPCGLILNELAGNALKHAFPNNSGGEVEVGFTIDQATKIVCLRVRDNGVGLPSGFAWSQSEGLGLQLVKILAGQVGGTVETETGPDTEFKIIFPLKENKYG